MDGRVLLMAALLATATGAGGEVYTWVDEDGVRHFSDRPVEGARRLRLPPVNTYTPPGVPATGTAATRTAQAAPYRYERVRILSPQDGQTVRDNGGRIEVRAAVEPPLRQVRGDRLEVILDGAESRPAEGGVVVFENVPRGEHRLMARVIDADGRVLAESPPVTFYLHRYSALLDADGANAGPIRRAPTMPRAPLAPRAPRLPGGPRGVTPQ